MTFRYKNAGHLAYIPEPLSSLPELSHAFVEPTKPASPWMSRKPSGSARTSSCSRKARLNRRRRSGLERGRKEGKLEIGRKLIDSRDPRQRTQILPEDHRHLRHRAGLHPRLGNHSGFFRHGAEQTQLRHPRPHRSRGHHGASRQRQGSDGAHHLEKRPARQDSEARRQRRQKISDRKRNEDARPIRDHSGFHTP